MSARSVKPGFPIVQFVTFLAFALLLPGVARSAVYSSGVTSKSRVTDLYREVIVVQDGASLYTANNFNGGYIGLAGGDDVSGHWINFSIWDNGSGDLNYVVAGPDPALGGTISRFGNEGTGAKTTTNFRWEFGVFYRTYVKVEHRDGGTLYSGWISEIDGDWHLCGRIFVPGSQRYLGAATLFLETLSDHEGYTRRVNGGKLGWVRDSSGWDPMDRLRWHCQSGHIERASSEVANNCHYLTFEQNNHSPWYPSTSHDIYGLTPSPATEPQTMPAYDGPITNITDVPTMYLIDKQDWTVRYADSEQSGTPAEYAIDDNTSTWWHTQWYGASPSHPHELQIDLGSSQQVGGFGCIDRTDGNANGSISECDFYVSDNPSSWGSPVDHELWTVSGGNKLGMFPPLTGRYVRLVALAEVNDNPWTSLAELNLYSTNIYISLPDFTGQAESDARSTLTQAGLVPNVTYQFTAEVPAGEIISQSPPAGENAYRDSAVTLVVSAGPTPAMADQSQWSLIYTDSQEISAENGFATNAFDGDTSTIWHTQYSSAAPACPHEVQIDLGSTNYVRGIVYTPRPDGTNGRIADYELYLSTDPQNWGSPVATGTWPDSPDPQIVAFAPVAANSLRLVALSEINDNPWASIAELDTFYADLHKGSNGLHDLAALAANWLDTCGFCNGADLNYDSTVNIQDLQLMAENWLTE